MKHIVEQLVLQNVEIRRILQRTNGSHLPSVNRAEATDEGIHDSMNISLSISSADKICWSTAYNPLDVENQRAKKSSSVIHNASASSAIYFVNSTALPFSILLPSFWFSEKNRFWWLSSPLHTDYLKLNCCRYKTKSDDEIKVSTSKQSRIILMILHAQFASIASTRLLPIIGKRIRRIPSSNNISEIPHSNLGGELSIIQYFH